jgi:serine/threonine protein kinase
MILNPSFSFYSEKKELLFTPFMTGGTLPNFLAQRLPLSKQDTLFYVAQIIIFLGKFHAEGKIYSNVVLTNMLVK